MTDNVVNFNGITKLDLPADRILTAALSKGLEGVIIIGWDAEGMEYFASSMADGGEALWLVERFKKALLEVADQ